MCKFSEVKHNNDNDEKKLNKLVTGSGGWDQIHEMEKNIQHRQRPAFPTGKPPHFGAEVLHHLGHSGGARGPPGVQGPHGKLHHSD